MQTDNKLILSPSPHVWDKTSTSSVMLDVIVALMPTLFFSIYIFGAAAITPVAACVLTAVACEWAYQKAMKKPVTIGDMSAVVTGMLIGFNMPVGVPLYIAAFASIVAILLVKQLYGGIGQNFANPAITARIIALLSFGGAMTTFLLPVGSTETLQSGFGADMIAGATPLAALGADVTGSAGTLITRIAGDADIGLPSVFDMLLGFRGGCIGETATLALIIGGIYLLYRGVITWHIPATYLGGVAILSLLFGVDPVYHLLSGGVILAAFFMATDYVTSPVTSNGKLIYGLGCALITMVIRMFGSLPEGASYSIIIMNILTPHISNLTLHKPFGGAQK